MEQLTDSDLNSAMCPSTIFYNILNQIQASNLNFQLQMSPFSAVVSLKKSFVKNKSGTTLFPQTLPNAPSANTEYLVNKNQQLEKDILKLRNEYEQVVENSEKVENSVVENENLKIIISEQETQLHTFKNESLVLKTRLKNAEDELVKYFSEKKDRDAKLLNEITTLKSRIKEDSETILEQKTEAKSAIKIRKSLEKKIDNLNNKVESLKTEKADLKREIQKLPRHSKVTKSVSIQTDDDPNNNLPIQPPSIQTISTSSQTILGHPRLTLDLLSESEASVSFECYVCNKVFHGACEIEEHANDDHNIKLNLERLVDKSEEDSFVRFVKSIVMENNYINARMNLYPNNWDHIEERIKIRLLAQKKLEICSWNIGNNMRRIAERNFKYPETNCDLAEV